MDPDGDDGVHDHEEGIEDSLDDIVSVSSHESLTSVTYEEMSLRLNRNDPELDELLIGDWGHCPSNAYEWQKIGESIARNTHLKMLSVWKTSEEDVEDVERFFCGVAKNVSIQNLSFYDVSMRRELLNILVPFFTNNHDLEKLDFKHCTFESTYSIASALSQFSSLKEFELVEDHPSELHLQPIIDALSSHFGLRRFYAHNLSTTVIGEFAFALETLLQNTKSNLASLSLSRAHINDQAVAILATGLASNITLRLLSIDSNPDITETGWISFFAALRSESCRMEKLIISNNHISDAAVQSLIDVLIASDSLSYLNISSSSQTTVAGWRALFLALQSPACALKALSVTQNALGSASAVLPAALSTNTALESLNLTATEINDATAVALANVLASNNNLTCLNLSCNNHITKLGWSALLRALCNPSNIMRTFQSNHTLRVFGRIQHPLIEERVELLLRFNRGNSKNEAAHLKIIETHFRGPKGFVVQPFVDMNTAVLPRAIAWMSKHSASGGIDEYVYGFLRNTKAWLAGASAQVNRKAKKQKNQR